MSDASSLTQSPTVSAGRPADASELWGLVMLWTGPMVVFGLALFLAR